MRAVHVENESHKITGVEIGVGGMGGAERAVVVRPGTVRGQGVDHSQRSG